MYVCIVCSYECGVNLRCGIEMIKNLPKKALKVKVGNLVAKERKFRNYREFNIKRPGS